VSGPRIADDVDTTASYCRYVILAAALAGVILLILAGLTWTARLVHVGNLDAQDLADKVATPAPVSALDWPELHLNAVVAQPDEQSMVLLDVDWPAHPQRTATLLLALDRDQQQSLLLLSQWCASRAPVSPARRDGAELVLRRRQSLQRVHAVLVAEDTALTS
jgi:hypothetical protein